MTNQLLLIDSRPVWRLDQATRAQGFQGIASARAVLKAIDAKRAAEQAEEIAEAAANIVTLDAGEQTALPLADAA